MKKFRLFLATLLSFALVSFSVPATSMAAYPDRPIVIIIPFGPGGSVDTSARILAEYLAKKYDITLQIVCKGGGAGAPAMLDVARARPDGYTLGFVSTAPFVTTPQIKKTGYTKDSFVAVVQYSILWLTLAVNSDSGITTFLEFVEAAKKTPNKYNFSSYGALSTQRLLMVKLMENFPDVKIPHIAYASGHESATSLLGRHTTASFGVPTNHVPYIKSKDFTMIGISSPERVKEFPDVPTFREAFPGSGDEYVLATIQGFIAPKGTPPANIEIFQNLVKEALADPTVIKKLAAGGLSADYGSTEVLQEHIDTIWLFISDALKAVNFK